MDPVQIPKEEVAKVDLSKIDNAVLRRLIEDVRNDDAPIHDMEGYNRQHNRHNRGPGDDYNRQHNRHNRG